MKTQFIKSNISGLPQWAKGVIAVAVVGGVGLVLYNIYKKIKESQGKKNQTDVVKDAKKEEQDLIKSGMKYTHPQSTYSSTANFIQNSLDGCEVPHTELDVVRKVMTTVENKLDWVALINAFGVRVIDNCGFLTGETSYSLPELLNEQLGAPSGPGYSVSNGRGYTDKYKLGRQEKINAILRRYLKSKGIEL